MSEWRGQRRPGGPRQEFRRGAPARDDRRGADRKPDGHQNDERRQFDRGQRVDRPRIDARAEFLPTKQPGLWSYGQVFLTKNLLPGKTYFELEREHTVDGIRYRELDPCRSKFAAAIARGLQQSGLKEGAIVLYLGASHGYTPSFFSDIVGASGMLFCLDFAPRVVRDLVFVCATRENMAPILADAGTPESYADLVPQGGVDVVYQDIAQRDQLRIFLANCDRFLKAGGHGMLAIKARSMDVTKRPQELFREIRKTFEEHVGYTVIEYRELDPFERDHAFFVVRKR